MAEREISLSIIARNAAKAAFDQVQKDLRDLGVTARQTGPALSQAVPRNFVTQLASARGEVAALTPAMRAQIEAGLRLGASHRDIAQSLGLSSNAMRQYRTHALGASQGVGSLVSAGGLLRTLLPGLSVIGLVAGVKSLATAALTAADRIVTLSNKTGISIEQIQRMDHVAKQTGTSVEALAQASFKLGVNVASGGTQAREAITGLGLSFEHVRSLKPEDQFNTVIKALEGVDNVTERNRLGVALFGKQFSEIATVVAEGYTRMKDEAAVAGDAQVRAAEAAGDAWENFKSRFAASMINVMGSAIMAIEEIERGADSLSNTQKAGIALSTLWGKNYLGELRNVGKGLIATEQAQKAAEETQKASHRATAGAAVTTADYVKQLAAMRAEVGALSTVQRTQLNAALKIGGDEAKQYAESIGLSEEALRLYQSGAKAGTKQTRELTRDTEKAKTTYEQYAETLRTSVAKAHELARDHAAALRKTVQAQTKAINDGIASNALTRKKHEDELDTLVRSRTMSRFDFQVDQIARWVESEKRQLDHSVGNWEAAANAIEQVGAEQMLALVMSSRTLKAQLGAMAGILPGLLPFLHQFGAEVKEIGTETEQTDERTRTWGSTLATLSESFRDLATISGDTFGGIVQWLGQTIASIDLAHRAGETFRDGWKDRGSVQGMTQVTASIVSMIAALDQATGSSSRLKNTLGGALVGAQAGAAIGNAIAPGIGGAIGAGIGGLVGAIAGLLRRPAFADVMRRVGHDWGVNISEGLAKSIADTAKTLFGGDRQAAEIFNLDKIMAEAGGPKPETIQKFTSKMRDAFSLVAIGKFSREQAAEVLDKNFQALVDVAKKKGGLITAALREIMALNEEFGTKSVAVSAHIKTSVGAGIGHLTTFLQLSANAVKADVGEMSTQLQTLEDERERLTRDVGDGRGSDADLSRISEITKQITDLQAKMAQAKQLQAGLAITSQASAGSFAAAIAGSFQRLLAEGVDPFEAIGQVEPAVLALQGQLDRLGIDGGAAFLSLRAQIALTRDEVAGPMTQGMRAVGSAITELYNAGVLTDDMFVGMAGQIGQTFQALVAQGHQGQTAMSLMKPQLQAIWELQQRFGSELDDSTQKLLDEAEAAGLVGDKHKSASERMVDGIGKVVDRLDVLLEGMGIKLPEAIGTGINAIVDQARRGGDAVDGILKKIPRTIPVDVVFNVEDRDPTLFTTPGAPIGSITGAARGVFATRPTLRVFGEGGEPELGGSQQFMAKALAGALALVGRDSGGSPRVMDTRERTGPTVLPMVVVLGMNRPLSDVMREVNRHLATQGISGNDFGLRDVIEHVAQNVYHQEHRRG